LQKKYKKALCRFKERVLPNNQNTYESLSCAGCFLSFNNNGKVRRLKKKANSYRLTQAQFLPRDPRFLAAHRGTEISIDFSKFNDTDFSKNSFRSFLADPKKDVVVNRNLNQLTQEETMKHKPKPKRDKFLRHSKPKHRSSNLQKDADNQPTTARKINIKATAKID